MILACAEGQTNTAVARAVRVAQQTVCKWRQRFVTQRLDGLLDGPRPGAPRTVTDAAIERIITQTLEARPAHATHWSTRAMEQASGVSRSTVHRIWRAFGLQPHRTETFKLSADPLFVEKVRDIAGLYLNPPDKALVLCVDEKAQIQALDRTRPLLPMRPGQVERRTHDYRTPWHHVALRRLGSHDGSRHWATPPAASGHRVPSLSRYDRGQCPTPLGRASDSGQLWHA